MTCGTCTHWRLQGALSHLGYGQCMARPEQFRGMTSADWATCRIGKFVPIMPSMAAL
ncbi:hypothetical protein [Variovorax sp.]|uniref:hypothetical protein n=1 Tax=Variovorax sp. TaxID=1871043 RepID=UPI003BAB9B4C